MPWYRPLHDDDWLLMAYHGNRIACCDCGLVHQFNFKCETTWWGRRDIYMNAVRLQEDTDAYREDNGDRMIKMSKAHIEKLNDYSDRPLFVRISEEEGGGLVLDLKEAA